jgi:hypothetical protein
VQVIVAETEHACVLGAAAMGLMDLAGIARLRETDFVARVVAGMAERLVQHTGGECFSLPPLLRNNGDWRTSVRTGAGGAAGQLSRAR